jgi:hypothetical protein
VPHVTSSLRSDMLMPSHCFEPGVFEPAQALRPCADEDMGIDI